MQYKEVAVGQVTYFWFAANTTAGTAADGASPLYDVRGAGAASSAAPTASGTPTLLTHANYSDGLHEIAIDTTGYSVGEYAVFCTLTISTVNPAGFVGSFLVVAASTTSRDLLTAIKSKTDNLPTDPADQSALQTLIEDVPTVAEFNARTLPTASYATASAQTTLQTSVDDIPTNAELATSQAAADDATLAAIGILQTSVDNVPTNAELATALDAVPTAIENADALLDRNMATGTDSGTSIVRTPRQALRFLRNKWGPDGGGNISVKKEDDSTESWKFVPTTTTGADPITASDPEGP